MPVRPLFVFGVARSGTNLLARLLDRHPAVVVALDPLLPLYRALRNTVMAETAPEELRRGFSPEQPFQDHYFDDAGPGRLDLFLAAPTELPLQGVAPEALGAAIGARAALESPALGEALSRVRGDAYRGLFERALEIIAAGRPGVRWVGCKEVWVLDFLPFLARIFPDARFYVLERDPRAIVASLRAMAESDPSQAAHAPSYLRHWRKQVALLHHFAGDPALAGRVRTIGYESLVGAPEAEARRLCAELDLDFDPRMLDVSADGWRGNSSYADAAVGVHAQSVDRWRQILPPGAVATADWLCGPEMRLTPYRRVAPPDLDAALAGLMDEDRQPGAWRSDGDLLSGCGGEILRLHLADHRDPVDPRLARRCFLFSALLDRIRSPAAPSLEGQNQ